MYFGFFDSEKTIGSMLNNLGRLKKLNHKQTFASLRYPNYKLWFWGQMISLFGTWMQTTAQGYLVFELHTRLLI
jgi:hypothetical protein